MSLDLIKQLCTLNLRKLTAREKTVLSILIRGRLDKEIAQELNISPETVKTHNKNIYKKLNVRNRSEVIFLMSVSEGGVFLSSESMKQATGIMSGT